MEVAFYPCHPSSFFFFSWSEAPASELSSPKRQEGRQPSKTKAGWGGQGEVGQPQASFLPSCSTFPDYW